jgi:putative CocE/NonD family hydrolase
MKIYIRVVLVLFLSILVFPSEKESRFGVYKGYSKQTYDSWVRKSQYVRMEDGVKLAVDVIRPAIKGKIAEEPLPVIWSHSRYRRAFENEGKTISSADRPDSQLLLKHGYIIAVADVRGSGASFGKWMGIFTKEETQDAYEITEWLAAQPWCDGNVGMTGGSYLGITQLMVAAKHPPHLKALFPSVALFDMYTLTYPGGVFQDDIIKKWSNLTVLLDTKAPAAPVDDDKDRLLLKKALKEHESNRTLFEILSRLEYRDSKDTVTNTLPYYEWHPAGFVSEINTSGIPVYLWCGWFDSFTRDGFLMYRNFRVPRKITMGPWPHSPKTPEDAVDLRKLLLIEQLRWFDRWLKGIKNGIMQDPPIHYRKMRAGHKGEWAAAEKWPLPGETRTKFYFHAGPSGSIDSVNDGQLNMKEPAGKSGKDVYTVDYTASSGPTTRYDNAVGDAFGYADMRVNDRKGLTYTTAPLTGDIEVTGHITVHLRISSTAPDVNLFAYFEAVDNQGYSRFITDGIIKASHRALHKAPYDNLGLPFHRSHKSDIMPLKPNEPVELVFDMHPTSWVFDKGSRIRVTITCADRGNLSTPELSPPPVVTLYRNASHRSYINLPVIQKSR